MFGCVTCNAPVTPTLIKLIRNNKFITNLYHSDKKNYILKVEVTERD